MTVKTLIHLHSLLKAEIRVEQREYKKYRKAHINANSVAETVPAEELEEIEKNLREHTKILDDLDDMMMELEGSEITIETGGRL